MDLSDGKKKRKFYSIIPDRWNLGKKVDKKEFEESRDAYLLLVEEDDLSAKLELLQQGRVFIHCIQGISRSISMAMAYIIFK